MFYVYIDKRAKKKIARFPRADRARISRLIELFSERGFSLSEIFLKKLSVAIWELRPGRVRLLFGVIGNDVVIVNVFMKKTIKTPKKELELAERRFSEYL